MTLRQLANSELPELNRRAFRLQTKIAGRRSDAGAAGHFLAVDPQTDFAVDAPDVIMIPLIDAFAQVFRRKTPLAIRRHRRKRLHRGGTGREHVAVRCEPVGLLSGLLLVLLLVTVIEYLH